MSNVSRQQLAEAALQMLAKNSLQTVATALASYLVAERRSKELDLLIRDIQALRLKRQGISEAVVTSARQLDAATKKELVKLSGISSIQLNYQQDPLVVAGVRMRGLDWQLDATVTSKLSKLKTMVNQQV